MTNRVTQQGLERRRDERRNPTRNPGVISKMELFVTIVIYCWKLLMIDAELYLT